MDNVVASQPVSCPECGGTDLEWAYSLRGPPGIANGRHVTSEIVVQVYLGCSECSHTVHVETLDQFLVRVALMATAQAEVARVRALAEGWETRAKRIRNSVGGFSTEATQLDRCATEVLRG